LQSFKQVSFNLGATLICLIVYTTLNLHKWYTTSSLCCWTYWFTHWSQDL